MTNANEAALDNRLYQIASPQERDGIMDRALQEAKGATARLRSCDVYQTRYRAAYYAALGRALDDRDGVWDLDAANGY